MSCSVNQIHGNLQPYWYRCIAFGSIFNQWSHGSQSSSGRPGAAVGRLLESIIGIHSIWPFDSPQRCFNFVMDGCERICVFFFLTPSSNRTDKSILQSDRFSIHDAIAKKLKTDKKNFSRSTFSFSSLWFISYLSTLFSPLDPNNTISKVWISTDQMSCSSFSKHRGLSVICRWNLVDFRNNQVKKYRFRHYSKNY